ncbi:MAG: phosphatidylserine decarboxylase [Candidatus Woesearchaeota archaeon]
MSILTIILLTIITIALLLLLFYRFWFLRDPLRCVPSGHNIVSPADGRIIELRRINGSKSRKANIRKGKGTIEARLKDTVQKGYLITIFMTPFDVHYQRAPCEGKITGVKYTEGSFRSADKPRPENENNQILMKTGAGNIKVIQIAGFMARRIDCFVKKNQKIKKGQKLGLIKLGSQVTLIMPSRSGDRDINPRVKKGERVKAGETIIAEF